MILMYHKVYPESPTMWWVEADAFRRQMLELRNRKVVRLDDYDPANTQQVVITFDGVYRNVLDFAAPVLNELGYPFELFVTGNYLGRGNEFDRPEPPADFADAAALKRLVEMGGRLQWHGNAHLDLENVRDRAAIEAELAIPDTIRALDPDGFRWFGYPHGTFNDAVLDCVRRRFSGAVSCHQGNDHDPHCLNRLTATTETSFRPAGISVIIPCYNYGAYLAEAVESVLRQTLPPREILVSDDASTDDTSLVLDLLERRYGNAVRIQRNERNLGIVGHFNQAVAMTRGEYVCFLGADNRFRSDFLEHTAGMLDVIPGAAIAYTDFALFGPRAALVAAEYSRHYPVSVKGEHFHVVRFPDFDEKTRQVLLSEHNYIHGSSLFRRSAFDQASGYRESDLPEDWFLFKRMVADGWSAIHVPLPLLEYRQHSREQANVRLFSEAELQQFKEGYRQLQAEIARIKGSVSWRITAPLRAAWNLPRRALAQLRSRLRRPGR
jgi:glycosyltransferase involved in cell wall biosynthesis